MATDAKKEIESLRAKLRQWEYEYHTLDAPTVPDSEYDAELKRLRMLETEFPELATEDSPTQTVGGAISRMFTPVKHEIPMQSLSNIFNEEELVEWLNDSQLNDSLLITESKYDGLAVSIIYRKGQFILAATRGDGKTGEDISATILTIKGIPHQLNTYCNRVEVRGEVMMLRSELSRINDELIARGEKPYANCRNLAAGTLRQKDPEVARSRNLIFMPYDLFVDGKRVSFLEQHQWLLGVGFEITSKTYIAMKASMIMSNYKHALEHRADLPFDIDGMVIKAVDEDDHKRLPGTRKFPGWATAFKFPPDQARTRMRSLDWQVGRTGVLTPVARFEPISLAGVMVSNATLHNLDEIRRLGLMMGDGLVVTRAGDVIPKVVEAIPNPVESLRHPIMPPHKCPVCGGRTEQVPDQVAIRCVAGLACEAQRASRITHFASRPAMDIKGLGDKLIEVLVQRDVIRSPVDLYTLAEDALVDLERMASKSARNVISAIAASAVNADLGRFIFALGIPGVGESTGQALAKHFRCMSTLAAASVEELIEIDDIGPVVATEIVRFFKEPSNATVLGKLLQHIDFAEVLTPTSNALADMIFVVTGTPGFWSRSELEGLIEDNGGRVTGSVSTKTTYLVKGDNPGVNKVTKAKKLGIKVINSTEFVGLLARMQNKDVK